MDCKPVAHMEEKWELTHWEGVTDYVWRVSSFMTWLIVTAMSHFFPYSSRHHVNVMRHFGHVPDCKMYSTVLQNLTVRYSGLDWKWSRVRRREATFLPTEKPKLQFIAKIISCAFIRKESVTPICHIFQHSSSHREVKGGKAAMRSCKYLWYLAVQLRPSPHPFNSGLHLGPD